MGDEVIHWGYCGVARFLRGQQVRASKCGASQQVERAEGQAVTCFT